MKLYYLPGACPLATHIALEWIGMPYETERVARDELKKPAFLALNPVGSVPVLVDGELTLTQSAAILEYLAEINPSAGLMPETPKKRAEVRRWLSFINADIHRTFGNIFAAQYYTDNPQFQQELSEKSSAKLRQFFNVANDQLAGKEWIATERSIADPYLYTVMRWAKAKNIGLDGMANLQAFYQRMDADAGVQTALKSQGLT